MLEGLVSFLPEEHAAGIGAINSSPETRKKLAESSASWRCSECGATNSEIWDAHVKKFESQPAPEQSAPAAPEESKSPPVTEAHKDEEIQTQEPPEPAAQSHDSEPAETEQNQEPEVVTLPDGEKVVYPSEVEIRSFMRKMNAQIVGLDIAIALLTCVLVWLLYFAN